MAGHILMFINYHVSCVVNSLCPLPGYLLENFYYLILTVSFVVVYSNIFIRFDVSTYRIQKVCIKNLLAISSSFFGIT